MTPPITWWSHAARACWRTPSAFLASLGLPGLLEGAGAGNTAKTYLAGIRYTQIAMGLADPRISEMQQLEYTVKGFRKLSGDKAHLPGKMNILADALSRNEFAYFYSQVPGAHRYQVPAQVLNLLVLERPDWTSVAWTQLFTNFFQQA